MAEEELLVRDCASCPRHACEAVQQVCNGPFHCLSCWGEQATTAEELPTRSRWWDRSEHAAWLRSARASMHSATCAIGGHQFSVLTDPENSCFQGSYGYTGADCLWPAAEALAQHLAVSFPTFSGTAVELGAGSGVPGMLLSRLGAQTTLLTELPWLAPFTQLNIDANFGAAAKRRPVAVGLRWGCRADLPLPADIRPDLVCGSDLVYDRAHHGALLATLRALNGVRTLLAFGRRKGTDVTFLQAATREGWEAFEMPNHFRSKDKYREAAVCKARIFELQRKLS